MMKMINLGKLSFPALGLGTYKLTGSKAIDTVQLAIELGYRLFDTAQLYHNEQEVGTGIAQSGMARDQIQIITKVWPTNFSHEQFIPSVKESLKKLKTDHVDLLLIHWPHPELKVKHYIQYLQKCKDEGMAKEIGVSNYNIQQLEESLQAGVEIVCNEVEYHPWIDQHLLLDWMHSHDMPVIAYSPLGRGMMLNDEKLQAIAKKYRMTPTQVVLRWHMQKEKVIAVPKASSRRHLEENLDLFDFEISEADMKIMDSFSSEKLRVVEAQPGAEWD